MEMKNIIHISIMLILFGIILIGIGCGDADTQTNSDSIENKGVPEECEWSDILPESTPDGFNLIFKYGYGSVNKNVLNTFDRTYTKDMVVDPSITIDFTLTDEEMDRIYQKMLEVNFFCYPDEFTIPLPEEGIVSMHTPYQGYYFRVEIGESVKILRWEDEITIKNGDATQLRRLISLIRSIIESRAEYKELPVPRGGYL